MVHNPFIMPAISGWVGGHWGARGGPNLEDHPI